MSPHYPSIENVVLMDVDEAWNKYAESVHKSEAIRRKTESDNADRIITNHAALVALREAIRAEAEQSGMNPLSCRIYDMQQWDSSAVVAGYGVLIHHKVRIWVLRNELTRWRRLAGKLTKSGDSLYTTSDGVDMIDVSLDCSDMPHVELHYLADLVPGGKCHVQTSAYYSKSLVCKMD